MKAAYHSVQDFEGTMEALFQRCSLPSYMNVVEIKVPHPVLYGVLSNLEASIGVLTPSVTSGGSPRACLPEPLALLSQDILDSDIPFLSTSSSGSLLSRGRGVLSSVCLLFDSLDSKGGRNPFTLLN